MRFRAPAAAALWTIGGWTALGPTGVGLSCFALAVGGRPPGRAHTVAAPPTT